MSGLLVGWISCVLSFVVGVLVSSAWWAGWPGWAVYFVFLLGGAAVIWFPVLFGEPDVFERIDRAVK